MARVSWGVALALAVTTGLAGRAEWASPTVFVNEIHYDDADAADNEFVEIAGPAGTNLAGWTIELYGSGALYDTTALSGIIPDLQNGMGVVSFAYPLNGLQNGNA